MISYSTTVKCDFCQKEFYKKEHKVIHERFHTGEKPIKCEVCEKSFHNKSELNYHKGVHTGEKSFKCETCGKTFRLGCLLKEHIKTHSKEKPFKCELCGTRFRLDSLLKSHLNRKQSCTKSSIMQRLIKQTDDPKYRFQCKVCSKYFISLGGTYGHVKSCEKSRE